MLVRACSSYLFTSIEEKYELQARTSGQGETVAQVYTYTLAATILNLGAKIARGNAQRGEDPCSAFNQ